MRTLRFLLVDDSAADAGLVLRELRRQAGIDPELRRVNTAEAMAEALDEGGWDLFLADHSLAAFSAQAALQMVEERGLDTPFIVVSRTPGEEEAVEMMRRGAHDYLAKGSLPRLCAAVERELRQARTRAGRRKAESALRESEARLRGIVEQAAVGIVETSLDGTLTRANPRFCAILGCAAEELLGRSFTSLTHPDDVELSIAHTALVVSGRDHPHAIDKRYLRRDGSAVWVSVAPTLVKDEHGVARSVISMVEDISERKAAIEALRESEQRYRGVVETSPDVIWNLDADHRVTFISEAVRTLRAVPPAAIIGRPIEEFFSGDERAVIMGVVRRALRGEAVAGVESHRRAPDGSDRIVSYSAAPLRREDGLIYGVTGRTSDVTSRYAAERAAHDHAEQLRLAVEAIDMAFFSQDRELRYTWMHNPQLGYGVEQVIGRTDGDLLPAEAAGAVTEIKKRVLATGHPERAEIRVEAGAAYRDYALVIEPVRSEAGAITGVRGVSLDITDRTIAQEEVRRSGALLRETENRFRSVIENVIDLILEVDAQGVVAFASPSVQRLLGHEPGALIGNSALEFIHPDDLAAALEALGEAIEAPAKLKTTLLRVRHADGSWRSMETMGRLVPERGCIVINARDVTDRVHLEDQLRQAQKMEAVGRLAGGVAHDFNNLLSVILSYAEILREDLAGTDACAEVDEIRAAGERAAGLTRQLLAFSRRQVLQPRTVDLNAVVTGMERMLQRLIGEDVALTVVLAGAPAMVRVDPGQLEQVLLNLAVNARDAMPGGGKLEVVVAHAPPGGEAGLPLPHVRLSVRDTGTGMEPATVTRIFEPFFTTKAQGKGTGLGLSTCYGIVNQSGGFIDVDSAVGKGTAFHVYLPESEEASSGAGEPAPEAAGGHETILVVEDELSLRTVAAKILLARGYQVITAGDGAEALALYERAAIPPALILTDVVMPRMSGPELIERLREKQPHVRALFMSGYTGHAELNRGILDPARNLLQKPFTPEALSIKVREMLAT